MMYSESILIASKHDTSRVAVVAHSLQFVGIPRAIRARTHLRREMPDAKPQVELQIRLAGDLGAASSSDVVIVGADVHQGVLAGSHALLSRRLH